jgi:MSHA pilin protein MshD
MPAKTTIYPAAFIKDQKANQGFTLVELIIGIVLFSVALVTVVSVIMPQTRKAIDPIWQVRSVTLAQSILTEISSKAFDEASITSSGRKACNDSVACSASGSLGADVGESRNTFDDIDDYNGLRLIGGDITNSSDASLTALTTDLFLGFEAQITVFYDDNQDGINDDDIDQDGTLDSGTVVGNRKLIKVSVFTPDGEEIPFASYRSNF